MDLESQCSMLLSRLVSIKDMGMITLIDCLSYGVEVVPARVYMSLDQKFEFESYYAKKALEGKKSIENAEEIKEEALPVLTKENSVVS